MDKSFYNNLPKKRMGSGALFINEGGKFLILETTYKKNWEIPGGIVELDESIKDCCEREIIEEIGLEIKVKSLLCIDYLYSNQDVTEGLMFIFRGGILSQDQIKKIHFKDGEIKNFSFVSLEEVKPLLNDRLYQRIKNCLPFFSLEKTVYLENGKLA